MRRLVQTPAAWRIVVCALPSAAVQSCGASRVQTRWAGTQRRIVRPTEEDLADLMEDDEQERLYPRGAQSSASGSATGPTAAAAAAAPKPLSAVADAASLYHKMAAAASSTGAARARRRARRAREGDDGGRGVNVEEDAAASDAAAAPGAEDDPDAGDAGAERGEFGADAGVGDLGEEAPDRAAEAELHVQQQQQYYYELPVQELADTVVAYLRSTENVQLVVAEEEHILFPVLLERLPEFRLMQLLDIVDCHWSRSTMLRYGTDYKDAVRDRIVQLATAAATQLEAKERLRLEQPSAGADGGDADGGAASGGVPSSGSAEGVAVDGDDDDGDAVFVEEKNAAAAQRSTDAVLAHAEEEITAQSIHRALVVMGLSAGHRKRDLAFFQLLGNYLAFFINEYRNPHDLVRVLTALARAKIVPSPAFLNMLARRIPVLHKRVPLEPLPAYRAMVNFSRMGHTSMNTFRFLADSMVANMEKHIHEEKRKQARTAAVPPVDHAADASATDRAGAVVDTPPAAPVPPPALSSDTEAKARLRRLCGLKPSMFTKWLHILAYLNAPHQQYLRPLVKPVILPILPYLPPPSFTRLMSAVRLFKSSDTILVDALVTRVCDVLGPSGDVTRKDVMELLRLVSQPDSPIPSQLDRFLQLCREYLGSGAGGAATAAAAEEEEERSSADNGTAGRQRRGSVTVVLRPRDMQLVVSLIGALQQKDDLPLETVAPLIALTEDFAKHLGYLMELGVVALAQVDTFLERCERHQIPDVSGALEKLAQLRQEAPLHAERAAAQRGGSGRGSGSGDDDVDDEYFNQLDIDVREMFHKILFTGDWNTYGAYRPLPGPLQVDFRDELTKVSAFELLQAVDLVAKAYPGALRDAPRLFLTRSLLEKLGQEGEVVVEEETNTLVIRQPRAELLTRQDLEKFTELVQCTPLNGVRDAPVVWKFILEKAERLGVVSVEATAKARLQCSAA